MASKTVSSSETGPAAAGEGDAAARVAALKREVEEARVKLASIDPLKGRDFSEFADMPLDDREELMEALKDNPEADVAEILGFTTPVIQGIENIGIAHYNGGHYYQAALVFQFILQMDHTVGSSWRGLGACCHAEKDYFGASRAYARAVMYNPDDVMAKTLWGECLCMDGKREEGMGVLKEVVERGVISEGQAAEKESMYLMRARSVIEAGGGMPPRYALVEHGRMLADGGIDGAVADAVGEVAAPMGEPDAARLNEAGGGNLTFEQFINLPENRDKLQDIEKGLGSGKLTLADVGGIPQEQIDAGYVIACQAAESGDNALAVRVLGYLLMVDPYSARNYQLMGIMMQRAQSFEAADAYFDVAQKADPTDPLTLIYRGECKLMCGDTSEGKSLLEQGISAAENQPDLEALVGRAKTLLQRVAP